ncbi:MAG: glycosyltransferase family 2 protein [Maritimibacter sp.]
MKNGEKSDPMPRLPKWGIVATVDEPAPLIIAFAAYHLGIGAGEVHLYFDRPNPEAEAALAGLDAVFITNCTAAYWAQSAQHTRPDHVNMRQRVNANEAFAKSQMDWIIHADADEYLRPDGAVETMLSDIPAHIIAVRQMVIERFFVAEGTHDHIYEGQFRAKAHEFYKWREEVYGRFGKFMKKGLSGHDAGKTFLRVGTPNVRFGIHFAFDEHDEIVTHMLREPDALLHFDGMTALHYKFKMMRRLGLPYYFSNQNPDGPARDSQARFMRNNAARPREIERLFEGMMVLDATQIGALKAHDCLVPVPFDPRPYIVKSGIQLDLSPAAFDAALLGWAAQVSELSEAAP